jgi:Type III restriction enzyme, res subunit
MVPPWLRFHIPLIGRVDTDHLIEQADGTQSQFRYYFAQREAVETVIWLYDVRGARDKFDLLRFDASGAVSSNMFDEDWPRFVVKMATGAGKTKVLSLLIAWSYFHKLYEANSELARNFLLIAPNIIVLDRLRADFDGLRIFFNDPVLPDNGQAGQNWRDDFQIALHIQDDVRIVRPTGNIFLTNIHRVYLGEVPEPSLEDADLTDYFLSPFGAKPVGKTNDSSTDLGEIVRNVTVIVGLRAYAAKSNILPEQTLGRGLRRMYFGSDQRETVSVMGTPAFMDFVESIQNEGVTFERGPMGGAGGRERQDSLIVEVDNESPGKDIDALDIALPRLTRRFNRDFKDLAELDPASFGNPKLPIKFFTPEETREIVFKTMLDSEVDHTIQLDNSGTADYRSVVGYFVRQLLKDLRLVGGYEQLYPKVRDFIRDHLFVSVVDLDDPVILRNLSEPEVSKVLFDHFRGAINALTIHDSGSSRIEGHIRLRDTRPFRTEPRGFLPAKRSVFNRIVGEANADGLELAFAAFLEKVPDVQAFGKNYLAVGFKLDYVKANGDLSTYTPDFIVRNTEGAVWIVETKGRKELDVPQKMTRLRQWCADATEASKVDGGTRYGFVYVDQESFDRHKPSSFAGLTSTFREYQEG